MKRCWPILLALSVAGCKPTSPPRRGEPAFVVEIIPAYSREPEEDEWNLWLCPGGPGLLNERGRVVSVDSLAGIMAGEGERPLTLSLTVIDSRCEMDISLADLGPLLAKLKRMANPKRKTRILVGVNSMHAP